MGSNQIIIIGAGGHGKVAADIAKLNYGTVLFLDDRNLTECAGYPVVGKTTDFIKFVNQVDFFVAIGNPEIRKKVTQMLESSGAGIVSLIHPDAVISDSVEIGIGTIVMAGAVINTEARIGKSCIVNTCSSVDHESILEDYVHVAVGAHLAGEVKIGSATWVGAGATIINNVQICGECMIGAGAVVVQDIDKTGTYVGVPAGKLPIKHDGAHV